ncbi:MAG: Crp/Fnr family transcriptional regulator [Sphingobacteriales bacterium]|nr:MAG: Crp/Fnr family transcriptional regulator [Sphingobacteriales bacterium]
MTDRKILPIIHYLKSFAPLDKRQVSLIASLAKIVSYSRHDWLLTEGAYCDGMYFLNTGMVRTVFGQEDKEVTVWVTLPHHFLTSTYSYIKRKPSMIGLQAISKAELIWFEREDIRYLYREIPVLRDISLSIMNDYYIELERLYIFCLAQSAKQRYANLYTHFPDHFMKVPLKYLASMIHVKPETLSRIRRMQQGKGFPLSNLDKAAVLNIINRI